MAKLSAHNPIWIEHALKNRFAWCEDGKVLKNYGQGWKKYSKIKVGLPILETIQKRKETFEKWKISHPAWWRLLNWLDTNLAFPKRYRFMTALEEFSHDAEACLNSLTQFDYAHDYQFDLRTIQNVCYLHQEYLKEKKAKPI